MSHMFWGASKFNQPLNDWEVSKVTDMSDVFYEANNMEDKNKPKVSR